MSSNAGAGGNPPRLARNDARHTINNNQAQARSNHSAPDLRHHLNDKRAEATRNNNDDDDVGPRCFGPAIRGERFPSSFKGPREAPKYNAAMNPETWVQDYLAAMSIQNASSLCCARYFPLMLEGTARTWLNNLPRNSVNSWGELKRLFITNFEGTCKRPATVEDLKRCVQKEGESTRKWYRRVADLINSAEHLSVDTVHSHLEDNTTFESLKQKLWRSHKGDMTMGQLLAIVHKYAESDVTKDDSEEDDDEKKGGKNKSKAKHSSAHKRKGDGGSELVAATAAGGRGFKSQRGNFPRKKLTATEILAMPCRYHSLPGKPAGHTTDECSWTAEIVKAKTGAKKRAPDGEDDGEQQQGMPPTAGFMGHTFVGLDSRREEKVIRRAVHATLPDVP